MRKLRLAIHRGRNRDIALKRTTRYDILQSPTVEIAQFSRIDGDRPLDTAIFLQSTITLSDRRFLIPRNGIVRLFLKLVVVLVFSLDRHRIILAGDFTIRYINLARINDGIFAVFFQRRATHGKTLIPSSHGVRAGTTVHRNGRAINSSQRWNIGDGNVFAGLGACLAANLDGPFDTSIIGNC